MENVHKSAIRPWIADRIIVKEFKQAWFAELENDPSVPSSKFLFGEDLFSQLEDDCGINNPNEFRGNYDIGIESILDVPDDTNLQTLKQQKEDGKKRIANKNHDYRYYRYFLNYSNYPNHKYVGFHDAQHNDGSHEEVQQCEVMLHVQLFQPMQKGNPLAPKRYTTNFQVAQEFLVLGCQTLTELRDKIECLSDDMTSGDMSDNPLDLPDFTCKDLYKSGFFYFDDTFYNDMRHPDSKDYSDTILTWNKEGKRGLGPFKTALMENTRFEDLSLQLGYPYVYVHQGYCEHIVVFADLLMHNSLQHSCNLRDYPAYVQLKQKRWARCMICRIYNFEWIVYDNKRLPESPYLFCKKCYLAFNYDEENQKIGQFRAYHVNVTQPTPSKDDPSADYPQKLS